VIRQLLTRALEQSPESRARALIALDGREDGLTLGRLAPGGAAGPPAATAVTLEKIGGGLSPVLFRFLDDPDAAIRATSLRILAKLDDERLTPAQVVALVTRAPAELTD